MLSMSLLPPPLPIVIAFVLCSHKNKTTQWEHPLTSLDDKDTESKWSFVCACACVLMCVCMRVCMYVCVSSCPALQGTQALAAIINPPVEMHYLHFKAYDIVH